MSDEETTATAANEPTETVEPTATQPSQPAPQTSITLAAADVAALVQHRHVADWLHAEVTRLEAQLAYVRARAASLDQEALSYVSQRYGVAGGMIDLEHGLLHVHNATDGK